MKSVIRAEALHYITYIILYALTCICVSSITEINAQVLSGNIIGYIYTYADTRIVKNERGTDWFSYVV